MVLTLVLTIVASIPSPLSGSTFPAFPLIIDQSMINKQSHGGVQSGIGNHSIRYMDELKITDIAEPEYTYDLSALSTDIVLNYIATAGMDGFTGNSWSMSNWELLKAFVNIYSPEEVTSKCIKISIQIEYLDVPKYYEVTIPPVDAGDISDLNFTACVGAEGNYTLILIDKDALPQVKGYIALPQPPSDYISVNIDENPWLSYYSNPLILAGNYGELAKISINVYSLREQLIRTVPILPEGLRGEFAVPPYHLGMLLFRTNKELPNKIPMLIWKGWQYANKLKDMKAELLLTMWPASNPYPDELGYISSIISEDIRNDKTINEILRDLTEEIHKIIREYGSLPPKPSEVDDLEWIFKAGKGTCVQYATISTLALRATGIKSHLTVGYIVNVMAISGGTYYLRLAPHAWTTMVLSYVNTSNNELVVARISYDATVSNIIQGTDLYNQSMSQFTKPPPHGRLLEEDIGELINPNLTEDLLTQNIGYAETIQEKLGGISVLMKYIPLAAFMIVAISYMAGNDISRELKRATIKIKVRLNKDLPEVFKEYLIFRLRELAVDVPPGHTVREMSKELKPFLDDIAAEKLDNLVNLYEKMRYGSDGREGERFRRLLRDFIG